MNDELVIRAFKKAKEITKDSTCNVRQVGSVLILDGIAYVAANTSSDSCVARGPDFCSRDDSVGDLEYLTCPSPCSEGNVIMGALLDGNNLNGGTLVSTDFPCGRCRSIIIDTRIAELYFGVYKDVEPRLREGFYTAQMIHAGVRVGQVLEAVGEDGSPKYRIVPVRADPAFDYFATSCMRTSGLHYLRLMTDAGYREAMAVVARELKEQSGLIGIGRRTVTAKPLL